MTPAEFVRSVAGFGSLNSTEQVKRFCWYLTFHRGVQTLTGADVGRCFDESKYPRPSAVGPFLTSLANQKPPFLIKRAEGKYGLSQHAHDQFDVALGGRESTVTVDKLLQVLPSQLTVDYERVYLEEALTCFRNSAFRATVVMAWNLAYDHLCNVILNRRLADFNTQLPKSFPKADIQQINVRDDFTLLKESQVIQVAKSAKIVTDSVHKVLKEKLDRRNVAAHPSGVAISRLTAEEFVLDLVQNVVLKL